VQSFYRHKAEPKTAPTAKEDGEKSSLLQEIGRPQMDNHTLKNVITSIRFQIESVKNNRNTCDEMIQFYAVVQNEQIFYSLLN